MMQSFLWVLFLGMAYVEGHQATSIVVNNTGGGMGGSGCTLRDAITAANTDQAVAGCAAGSGVDTIVLPANAVITLTTVDNGSGIDSNGLPVINSNITIHGNHATIERSSSNAVPDFRVFSVDAAGTLILNDATVRNGKAPDTSLSGHPGGSGGGISSRGSLYLTNCSIMGNRSGSGSWGGGGGGIQILSGTANISNSTISGNRAGEGLDGSGGFGGGIFSYGGTLHLIGSTINDNRSGNGTTWNGYGGGISLTDSPAEITNCTLYNNIAGAPSSWGGGIYREGTGDLIIISSTLAGNAAGSGGGLFGNGGNTTIKNTIVANNLASSNHNCNTANGGAMIDGGNNLDSGTSCNWSSAMGSLSSTDPLLGPLASNGGTTATMAIPKSSPAVDGVTHLPPNGSPTIDQRGFRRPFGPRYDMGAFEYMPLNYAHLPSIRKPSNSP